MPHTWSTQRLLRSQEEAFRQAAEKLQQRCGGRMQGKDVRQLLAEQFGVIYHLNGVYDLLKRLDMARSTVRSVSPHANAARQAAFQKNFSQKGQTVLPPDVPLEQIEIWFQDEMRIVQRGTQTRIWARKRTRPQIVRQQKSESAYLFGAVWPARDAAVGLVLPYANITMMDLHLEEIRLAMPPGRHALLVLNQAGWHTTKKLPHLTNVSLLLLLAGSTELNPAEQVWQQLCDRSLANRCYNSYEDIVGASCATWNAFTQILGAIRSLYTRDWAHLSLLPGSL